MFVYVSNEFNIDFPELWLVILVNLNDAYMVNYFNGNLGIFSSFSSYILTLFTNYAFSALNIIMPHLASVGENTLHVPIMNADLYCPVEMQSHHVVVSINLMLYNLPLFVHISAIYFTVPHLEENWSKLFQ